MNDKSLIATGSLVPTNSRRSGMIRGHGFYRVWSLGHSLSGNKTFSAIGWEGSLGWVGPMR